MSERHLRQMDLDPEQVGTTARFLEACANTSIAELRELLSSASNPDGEHSPALMQDPAFTVAADAATSLREAGQWMLYLNVARAQSLLARSGQLFQLIGQAFGSYLTVVSGTESDGLHSIGRPAEFDAYANIDISMALDVVSGDGGTAARWPALRHPQQQAYLVLAAAGRGYDDERLRVILDQSMHRDGVVPVGALGTPIRRFWDVARHLVDGSAETPAAVAAHLAVMCRRYAECMGLAQTNRYLWAHASAPVDVGDVDIAGIAALTARRSSGDMLLDSLHETGISPEETPVAIAPVEAGLAMAEPWRDERPGGNPTWT